MIAVFRLIHKMAWVLKCIALSSKFIRAGGDVGEKLITRISQDTAATTAGRMHEFFF